MNRIAIPLLLAVCGAGACSQADSQDPAPTPAPAPAPAPAPKTQRVAGPPVIQPLEAIGRASLRGIAVQDADTVWVSGTNGTVRRSVDGGLTWNDVAPPGTETLDFRDIQLLDPETALIMSAGPGLRSRVYKTRDNGATWDMVFQNRVAAAFFNSIAFWDASRGIVTSDSGDGRLMLLGTEDAGETWDRRGFSSLPPLLEGEAGFAASGTVVATSGPGRAWVATGGQSARVFRTTDGGTRWSVFDTPMTRGKASTGIFSIAFRDADFGVVVGGDYRDPDVDDGNAAWTSDGGESWQLSESAEGVGLPHRSCVQHLEGRRYIAAGRSGGLAYSENDGRSWSMLESPAYFTIGYDAASGVGYLAGSDGRVGRFTTLSR